MGPYQKFYVLKRRYLILRGLTLLVPVFFVVFCSSDSFAASLTMTLSSASLSFNILPNSTESTFASSTDLGISVTLSGPGGYTLGIKAASSNASARNLINSTANTALTTISSAITPANYTDNTYASTNNLNNTWAYLPSKYNSTDNTNYRPAPDANGDILEVTSGDGNGTAVNYTISMGVRASTSTKPGAYSNTFVIVAVANIPDCNPLADDIDEAVCLQDFNGEYGDDIINSMEPETQYQLYDSRDYKKYYIAKMKDGRVWMTQNLDLDLVSDTDADNYIALTSENTDLNTFGAQSYTSENGYKCEDSDGNDISTTTTACNNAGDIITWVPSNTTIAKAAGSSWSSSNSLPYSYDNGDIYYYASGTNDGYSTYNSESSCIAVHNDGTCPHYHSGNYYNSTAAVASNNTSSITTRTTMDNSICPAGWRLSRGRTSDTTTDTGYYAEINYSLASQGIMTDYVDAGVAGNYVENGFRNKIRTAPMYLSQAGYKSGSSLANITYIYYKTSTFYDSSYNYIFYSTVTTPFPLYISSSYAYKSYGTPIRCIVRQANTGSTVVTFNKNADDAIGAMSNQTISADTFGTLTANNFTRSGYIFNSWNTEPDGSGKSYADADRYYAMTGSITNNVTLYAQWDKGYIITFNTNNANGVYFDGNVYANGQSVMAYEGHKYVISGDYATRYTFSSWSVTAGTIENNSYQTTYYTMPSSDVTITLTGQAVNTKIKDLTLDACPTTPTPVYDERDNEVYWVAKLNDNKCWMLDNLRLDLTDSTIINNLSVDNTNADAASLTSLKNGNRTNGNQYATAGLSGSNWTSSYSYSVPMANVSGTVTSGVNGNTWTGSYTKDTIAPVFFGAGSGKVGVHYNYCAASAGSYCYGSDNNYSGSPSSDPNTVIQPTARDIASDICPKGWKMPTGGNYNTSTGGGNYQDLYNKYSGATGGQAVAFNSALSAPLVGYYGNDGSIHSYGYTGFNWSSTWSSLYYMYRMYNFDNSVASNGAYRYTGYSVRCVREPDTVNITVNFAGSGIEGVTFKNENGISQTVTSSGTTITLQKGIPNIVDVKYTTKHNFASWSATTGTPSSSMQNVTIYTADADSTITISGQEATIDMTSFVASTDPVSSNCKNEAISPILVYDPRDNETYWVARLCDGKYWMLDNLRLDLTNSTVINNLSQTNTNASAEALGYLKNGGGTTSNKWPTAGLSGSNWTSSYSFSVPMVNVSGIYNNGGGSYTKDTVLATTYGVGSGRVGVYYNFCAASAGTYCWGNGTSSTGSPSSDPNTTVWPYTRDIGGDICPKGWRMPMSGGGDNEYNSLYYTYLNGTLGGTTVLDAYLAFRMALSVPLSGNYYSGNVSTNSMDSAYLWGSTWGSSTSMYAGRIHSTGIAQNSNNRYYGNSVRCVFGS